MTTTPAPHANDAPPTPSSPGAPGAPGPRRRARKPLSLKPVVIVAVAGVACALGVLALDHVRNPQAAALKADEGLDALVVPEFTMTAQNGETFTRSDLLGRVTVLDFFFTSCPAICPALARSMKQIQDAVGDRGVRLVSISVDPEHDTVPVLRAHAEEVGADPDVWTFLRADDFEQVRRVSEDGLKLGLTLDEERPIKARTGADMPWIDHSGKLVLLDPQANVIGLYSGLDGREVAALIKRLERATRP